MEKLICALLLFTKQADKLKTSAINKKGFFIIVLSYVPLKSNNDAQPAKHTVNNNSLK